MEIQITNNNSIINRPIKPFISRDQRRIFHIYHSHPITGKRTKKSTRTTIRTKAETELDQFMRNQGVAAITQNLPKDLKLKDLELLLYSTNSRQKSTKSLELNKLAFRHLISIVGNKHIFDVSRIDADVFINEMLGKVERTSVNIYLRQLKYSFGRALEYGLVVSNPFQDAKQLIIPDRLRPNITNGDILKILSVMNDEYMRRLTKFAFLTGMRISEIINLQWSDVDLENNRILIQNKSDFITKTRKNREIALTPTIRDLLIESRSPENRNIVGFRNPEHYIFGNKSGFRFTANYISHKFKKYVIIAGLDSKVCFHSLRHGALSNMALCGMPIQVLQEIAGHSDISTTERYLHTNMEQVRKYMEKVDYGF